MDKFNLGQWNGFAFRTATPDDAEEIDQLLHSNHFPEDFFSGQDFENYEKDFKKIWLEALKQNLSFVALHIQSQKIVGVRINYERTNEMDISNFKEIYLSCPQMKTVLQKSGNFQMDASGQEIGMGMGILNGNKYTTNVDKYAVQIVSCVSKEYRGTGLTIEMYDRTMEVLKSQNLYLCKLSPIVTNCLKVKGQYCDPDARTAE